MPYKEDTWWWTIQISIWDFKIEKLNKTNGSVSSQWIFPIPIYSFTENYVKIITFYTSLNTKQKPKRNKIDECIGIIVKMSHKLITK